MAANGRRSTAKPDGKASLNGKSKRRWIPMTVAGLAIAGFAGGVWYAYNQGVREGVRLKPPLIRAEPGPTKVVPEQPGGLEIPNQDKMIYERVTGETGATPVERLLPPAEKPSPDAIHRPPAVSDSAPAAPVVPDSGKAEPAPVAAAEPPPAVSHPAGAPAQDKATDDAGSAAAPAAGNAAADAMADGWRIQLAAFRDEPSTEVAWQRLTAKHADVLAAVSHRVVRADLGPGKGIYYRLQAGPFADKDAAVAACEALTRQGQGCLPVAP